MSIWKRFLKQYRRNSRYRTRVIEEDRVEIDLPEDYTERQKLLILGGAKAVTYDDESEQEE